MTKLEEYQKSANSRPLNTGEWMELQAAGDGSKMKDRSKLASGATIICSESECRGTHQFQNGGKEILYFNYHDDCLSAQMAGIKAGSGDWVRTAVFTNMAHRWPLRVLLSNKPPTRYKLQEVSNGKIKYLELVEVTTDNAKS